MSDAASIRSLCSLHETRRVRLRVHYPIGLEQLVLRTQMDWNKDVLPRVTDNAGSFAEFELETTLPFLYLKPCLRTPTGLQWAIGPNRLVVATSEGIALQTADGLRQICQVDYGPGREGTGSLQAVLESRAHCRASHKRAWP